MGSWHIYIDNWGGVEPHRVLLSPGTCVFFSDIHLRPYVSDRERELEAELDEVNRDVRELLGEARKKLCRMIENDEFSRDCLAEAFKQIDRAMGKIPRMKIKTKTEDFCGTPGSSWKVLGDDGRMLISGWVNSDENAAKREAEHYMQRIANEQMGRVNCDNIRLLSTIPAREKNDEG